MMNKQISALPDNQKVQVFKPDESAIRIHSLEIAEKIALRVKDCSALEKAVDAKLEEQALFAADFDSRFMAGGDRKSKKFQNDSTVNLKPNDYCNKFGFHYRTVRRWCEKLLDPEKREIERQTRKEKIYCLFDAKPSDNILVTKFTGNNEWYTPPEYIESARAVMGKIDVDPASNDHAQNTIKAQNYYTVNDNGLDAKWNGNVWLNPPYSSKEIKLFIDKLISELADGNTKQAILLTNNSTDTTWWHKAVNVSNAICFTAGRISFYDQNCGPSSPTNGQNFIYYGSNKHKFKTEFSKHGKIMEEML